MTSSATATRSLSVRACAACLRRRWLLTELSGPLEYVARDRGRLLDTLALDDETLLRALAGRRRGELRERYASFRADEHAEPSEHTSTICRHHHAYPRAWRGPGGPHMLECAGGLDRLASLLASPVVAIVGSAAASDYGLAVASSFARALSASGVTIVAILGDGIAQAALAGCLEARARTIAVKRDGLGVAPPARQRALYARVSACGCVVAETPQWFRARRWSGPAGERLPVEAAQLVVVVEAEQCERELWPARVARALGRTVAAVPGRVSSPLARGPHSLLSDGARLVCSPEQVLEILHELGCATQTSEANRTTAALEPRLQRVLDMVGRGEDTLSRLDDGSLSVHELMLALSELELMGALGRGDGGRYVPIDSLQRSDSTAAKPP